MKGDNANIFVLLELLRDEGYGSDLSRRILDHSNGEVKVDDKLSRQLRDMLAEGLLAVREVSAQEQGRPGPPAKVYSLTRTGRRVAVKAWHGMRRLLGNPPDEVEP